MNRVGREISFEGFCRYLHYSSPGLYSAAYACAWPMIMRWLRLKIWQTCTKIKESSWQDFHSDSSKSSFSRYEKLAFYFVSFFFCTKTVFGPCTALAGIAHNRFPTFLHNMYIQIIKYYRHRLRAIISNNNIMKNNNNS